MQIHPEFREIPGSFYCKKYRGIPGISRNFAEFRMFFKKFRIPSEVKNALPWTPYWQHCLGSVGCFHLFLRLQVGMQWSIWAVLHPLWQPGPVDPLVRSIGLLVSLTLLSSSSSPGGALAPVSIRFAIALQAIVNSKLFYVFLPQDLLCNVCTINILA